MSSAVLRRHLWTGLFVLLATGCGRDAGFRDAGALDASGGGDAAGDGIDAGGTAGDPGPDGDPAGADAGCSAGPDCSLDSHCPPGEACVAGWCAAVRWASDPGCAVQASGCHQGSFPDECYLHGVDPQCPSRSEELPGPACDAFLELGAEGPADDELVIRLLYDLWKQGQQAAEPPRPKVVMAVGDSISASAGYITARAMDCALPDFEFDSGYRLVGQPGSWAVIQTALGSTTALWGRSVLEREPWYQDIRPEMATVMFGTNELWWGLEDLQSFAANMRAIVDALLTRHVLPILVTLPPGTYQASPSRDICGSWCDVLLVNYQTGDFAQVVRDLAAEKLLPVVDLHARYLAYDKPSWTTLLSDGVHPCHQDCPPEADLTGCEVRDDAVLRMLKFLEAVATDRCPGGQPPRRPDGYHWDPGDILSNFRGAAPRAYCPDPVARCR